MRRYFGVGVCESWPCPVSGVVGVGDGYERKKACLEKESFAKAYVFATLTLKPILAVVSKATRHSVGMCSSRNATSRASQRVQTYALAFPLSLSITHRGKNASSWSENSVYN